MNQTIALAFWSAAVLCRFQAESLGHSSRGQRPRLWYSRLHLPCKGNPKRESNILGCPFRARKFFHVHSEGVALALCPRLLWLRLFGLKLVNLGHVFQSHPGQEGNRQNSERSDNASGHHSMPSAGDFGPNHPPACHDGNQREIHRRKPNPAINPGSANAISLQDGCLREDGCFHGYRFNLRPFITMSMANPTIPTLNTNGDFQRLKPSPDCPSLIPI